MKSKPPKIDARKFSDLLKISKGLVPHYTPEWAASDENDPGVALLKIFCHITENVVNRFNQVPQKNFVAFLDMLGIKLLPAQPSRVPLTFKLAEGTEKEIWIPERTQAAADKTEKHEELPFETEKNLLGIPSQLKKVISVDPRKDAIYLPPPGFLNGEPQSKSQVTYLIVSSPSAGARNFQLDHVTDIEEGDFLKIVSRDKTEYVAISSISGTIVNSKNSLLHAHPANTRVEKLTRFNLFEGKNMQEHSLHIGHKDLFNVKSTAQFSLDITHLAGMEAGVTPLKLSWEYWGEVKGEEGEDWHKFNTIDGTEGLSKVGTIELNKTTEGEITEKELIKEVKSRWIRCLLEEPLKVDVPRKLPALDNIVFKVKSSGKNLLPDQSFNNDIPLDITLPFTPFGQEPRMFDIFSIASKEAFSKKGGKVTLDVDVEPRGILGAPTAIEIEYGQKIKVFARGTYGRLMEVEIDAARDDPTGEKKPVWTDHGFPPDTKIASESTPCAVKYSMPIVPYPMLVTSVTTDSAGLNENISVFARAENGHLVESFFNGEQWLWIDHGTPNGVDVKFDPAAIYDDKTFSSVFVTGSDGNLYELNRSHDTRVWAWIDHGKPDDISIASSPYAVVYNDEYIRVKKVYVKGENGQLYEWEYRSDVRHPDGWKTSYGLPDPVNNVKVYSRPFASEIYKPMDPHSTNKYYAKVFVIGSDDALYELDTQYPDNWIDLGVPKENEKKIKDSCYPHGYVLNPELLNNNEENKHIFVRGTDDCLWERNDSKWISHQAPANSELCFSPFVLYISEHKRSHIFSASNQNSIIERVDYKNVWNEYKDPNETALTPTLSWEYWNEKGWVVLKGIKDETANLLKDGQITFDLPEDIEETEIAGQKSYWIRARLVGGDYGKESFTLASDMSQQRVGTIEQKLISTKNSIRPPIVNRLTIRYAVESKKDPQQCMTYNNLEYLDQTDACKEEDKHFSPFVQLEDKDRTLYLGFEKSFKGGPVKIFFAAEELPFTEAKKPKVEWSYRAKNDWGDLSYLDATEGLIKADILELQGPSDFSGHSRFGDYLYWIKGSLTKGEYEESPLLDGIYPNTTWAFQAETIKDEFLGSSDGEPKDEKGKVLETWVLWSKVPDFFDSKRADRHYSLDRATGELQFGDLINGMIPPAGDDNIKAFSYQAGGGAPGNVKAGEIKTLKSAVAGVDKVSNPVAADGGADTATVDQMLEIGPAMISHRNRAVTAEDFEWLAKEASRKVVKVRCLPNTNNKKHTEIGWVTVIIVPDSQEDLPKPSLELKRKVQKYLEACCANTLTSVEHIFVDGPSYVEIGVSVDVFVTSIDVVSEVEREIRKELKAFFHPLTGGAEGKGWDFGRDVAASDIYVLLEDIEGVDHVENLKFTYGTCEPPRKSQSVEPQEIVNTGEDFIEVKRDCLVATGTHSINIQQIKGGLT
jgi:hypothetical protein